MTRINVLPPSDWSQFATLLLLDSPASHGDEWFTLAVDTEPDAWSR